MAVRPVIRLTRNEIYDEVWSVAVSGMALKYSIPYSAMLKQIKDADIPIPPAGYWTKKEFNKETVIPPLQGDPNEVIELYKSSAVAARMKKASVETEEKKKTEPFSALSVPATEAKNVPQEVTSPKAKEKTAPKESTAPTVEDKPEQPVLGEPEIAESWDGRKQNIYRREVLYQEVWKLPVTEVAKKYAVSDAAIHKICKSLDVPTPPPGYWAKLRAGKHVEIPPLPKSDRPDTKTGLRTENEYAQITAEQLSHLPEEDQITIMAVASQIRLTDERDKLHSKVAAYQKKAKNGQSSEITDSVAKETIPRVIRILDTIVKAIEPLGVTVDDALRFNIGQDFVMLRFSEATTEIRHELTREEKMAMLKYEDERKHGHWASKPNIRKYDHVFNGRISVGIGDKRRIRDSKSMLLEDRLGEILIAIFSVIHDKKLAREEREEAERKRAEEQRKKEERRKRYNEEVAKTNALVNQAEDYAIACKIRAMVEAVEAKETPDEETLQWIAWAKAKADWYDPTVAEPDAFFGRRNHSEGSGEKALRERNSYYW